MYRTVEWAVPADPSILEELDAYPRWQTPKSLSLNTDFSRQWVGQRCRVYVEYGLAVRHEEASAYRITDFGRAVVADEIEYEVVSKLPEER